jgi:hypothetical protein
MIEDIRQKFRRQEYEYSLHAVDQSILKHITRKEIEEAVATGEIINGLTLKPGDQNDRDDPCRLKITWRSRSGPWWSRP